jgi:pimeloyl-ACP methyl ester carboxylesterase
LTPIALLLSSTAALALLSAPTADPPRVVKLKTADGLTLEADWYPGGEGMPGIVGLHMYPSDRTSWKPLAEKRPAGFHFLAVDLRGYGGSRTQGGKDLSELVKKRDPALFAAMWQDALAGVNFLRDEGKCDRKRIGLVGASVGCSVAIDATIRRGQDVAGVCVLTPGKDYLGVPTMDHVKTWREQPLLLLSSEEESEGGARPIAAALGKKTEVELSIVPGEKIHGTNMFGKVAGIEERVASWFEAVLGRTIPDGEVDPVELQALPGRSGTRTFEMSLQKSLLLRLDSQGINVLGEGTFPPSFALFVDPAGKTDAFSDGGIRFRGSGSPSGVLGGACRDTWTEGRWMDSPVAGRPGVLFVSEQRLEARIPWSILRLKPAGTRVRIGFAPISRKVDWSAPPETWADVLGDVLEVPK